MIPRLNIELCPLRHKMFCQTFLLPHEIANSKNTKLRSISVTKLLVKVWAKL